MYFNVRVPLFAANLTVIALSTLASASTTNAGPKCVPEREEIAFPHNGTYHRIHPSGNYFLYTEGSKSAIVDVTNHSKPNVIQTPMREETYPVEAAKGGWELIASPREGGGPGPNGGMDYYGFTDLIQNAKASLKPTYTDPQHGEYYHSSAELPGSTDKLKRVRTLLYSNRGYRDYEMNMIGEGKVGNVVTGKKRELCANVFKPIIRTPQAEARLQEAKDQIEREEELLRTTYRNATPNLQAELQNKIAKMRVSADDEYYGPAYVANRAAAATARAKEKFADEKFRSSQEYVRGKAALESAHAAWQDARRAVRSSPEVGALEEKLESLTRQGRLASSRNRRAAIEFEFAVTDTKRQAALKRLQDDTPAVNVSKLALDEADRAWQKLKALPDAIQAQAFAREVQRLDVESWEHKEGKKLGNPVLSKDGSYVAGLVNEKIEIFQIEDDGKCTSVVATDFRGSKVSFSYPETGKPLQITFTAEGGASSGANLNQAYVYNLESKKAVVISVPEDLETAYPGFTLNGRVMYKTTKGMTIVDPLQIAKNGCITSESVGIRPSGEASAVSQ